MAPQATEAPTTPSPPQASLLRVLGVGFGLAIIVGNTIGAGILRTPGEIAAHLPSTALFLTVWVAGGLYALLGTLSLAELGTMVPRSGGQYVFVRRALGGYPGFVVGWSDWLSTCGSSAAMAIVIGEYIGPLVPALGGRAAAVAGCVVVGFALLQWRGIRPGDAAQRLTSLLKAAALIALVAAILILGQAPPPAAAPPQPLPGGLALLAAFVVAFQAVIYTYDGWTGAIYFGEEVRDPGRAIPRAMMGGVLAVIAIYLSLNIAFLYVVPLTDMANDPFVAGTAAGKVFGPHGDTIIRLIMIVSLLAGVNACQLMASRVPLAMSRDGLLPASVAAVNRGTPGVALWSGTAVAVFFILTNTFETVLGLLAFFFVANYALSFTSVFVLRRKEPDTPRPYRAWGYPWTTGIALAGSIAFLGAAIAADSANSLRALLLLGLSLPAFLLVRSRRAH